MNSGPARWVTPSVVLVGVATRGCRAGRGRHPEITHADVGALLELVEVGNKGAERRPVLLPCLLHVLFPRHRRDGGSDAARGGGDPRYLRQTCEQSLKNLGVESLDVFCMSRVDPNVPIEESVGGMADLVKEGKTRFISLSECSAESLRRGSVVHPLVSLQMEYSLFSRDAEEQGQIDAC